MSWTVALENEKREVIGLADEEFALPEGIGLSHFELLKYLDPSGDTLFNCRQMDDLITDLEVLNGKCNRECLDDILRLARQCKSTIHTYIAFCGD